MVTNLGQQSVILLDTNFQPRATTAQELIKLAYDAGFSKQLETEHVLVLEAGEKTKGNVTYTYIFNDRLENVYASNLS